MYNWQWIAQLLGIFKANVYTRLRKYMLFTIEVWPGCVLEAEVGDH